MFNLSKYVKNPLALSIHVILLSSLNLYSSVTWAEDQSSNNPQNLNSKNPDPSITNKNNTENQNSNSLSQNSQAQYQQSTNTDTTNPNDAQKLDTIVVQADSQKNQSSEQQKGYTYNKARTATKLDLDLRETPQNVKVYTREYLDDRNITSFQTLMNNVTGVTASRTDERQSNYARGFQMDYYLMDGIPTTSNITEGDLDLGFFDRVEVVKGANGLMTGAGSPAMGLNLIRKHANSKELTGKLDVSAGSWNNYSSSADLSGGLNDDGSLRGRIYIKHSDENSFMDDYSRIRNMVYGALDYDVTDKTTLSLGVGYQQLERDGVLWGGLPAFYTDGTQTNFDRGLTVSSDWTYWDIDTTSVFASLKQNLWSDINFNVAYSYREDVKDTALLYFGGAVDKATGIGESTRLGSAITPMTSAYASHEKVQENNVDAYVTLPFKVANREQEIVVGGSWNKKELLDNYYGNPTLDNYNLNFNDMKTTIIGDISAPNRSDGNVTTQSAAYIAGKFHLFDPLKLVAGARLSNWKFESDSGNGNRKFDHEFTPYIGLIYDFAQDHSWYASYTNIFKPQDKKESSGSYLDPIKGKNYETGIKSQFFDGHLNTAVSVFRIEQTNVAEILDGVLIGPRLEQAYRAVDGVVSKGFEIEVDGQINENWALNFGIANFEAKDANNLKVNTDNSRTTANLFAKYSLEKWNAGLGLNYRSKITNSAGSSELMQDDIVLASAMLGYQIDPNIKVQLNLDNLFDKKYYEGIGPNRMNYGTPRSATLSFQYQF